MENQPEPYSLQFDDRRETACTHYQQRVVNAHGAWSNMINNRPAFRSKINRNDDRVVFARPEANTLIVDGRLNAVLKQEGLKGDEANIERVGRDRPAIFSFKNKSKFTEAAVQQWVKQMNIF